MSERGGEKDGGIESSRNCDGVEGRGKGKRMLGGKGNKSGE